MAAMTAVKPDRVINLAYYISSDLPPRVAFKLNVLGMDNCFEAARLAGCNRVVYASSVAVSGEQKFYGERVVNEDDFKHGHVQYAMHKIFNEWQAQDYREKHAMEITTIRPANVTGPDKVVGSVDHVFCITHPARGKPAVALPAEIGVVDLDPSRQALCGVPLHHRRHELVLDLPGGGLGDAKPAAQLNAGDAALALSEVVHGTKPSAQRHLGARHEINARFGRWGSGEMV